MKFAQRSSILITGLLLLASASLQATLYHQGFDGTGNAYSSQNDINGFGLFAQVYDNFTLGSSATIEGVQWTGGYFNPPQQGEITGWTIQFYYDAGGQPGGLLYSVHIAGNGNEMFLGDFGGTPTYTYEAFGLNFSAEAGTQYWLSLYPDIGFPPQWGWSSGTGGDGISYQDFFGSRSQLAVDMAFDLRAPCDWDSPNCFVPEPGSFSFLIAGLLCLLGKRTAK